MITNLGSFALSGLNPLTVQAIAAVESSLQAQLDGALFAQVGLTLTPPTLVGQAAAAAEMAAAIALAISLGVPDVSFQLAAVVDLIAALQAQLAILASITATLAAGGVYAYAFDGTIKNMGNELHAEVGGGLDGGSPNDAAYGVVMLTTLPATWDAIKTLFGLAV